jgi:hypothetical protein
MKCFLLHTQEGFPDEAADPIGYGKVPLGFRSGSDSDPDQLFSKFSIRNSSSCSKNEVFAK